MARESEGNALKGVIEQRLAGVTEEVRKVRAQMPEVLKWQRERLVSKLEEAEETGIFLARHDEEERADTSAALLNQRVDE